MESRNEFSQLEYVRVRSDYHRRDVIHAGADLRGKHFLLEESEGLQCIVGLWLGWQGGSALREVGALRGVICQSWLV